MHKLIPVSLIVILTSSALIISRILGILPKNSIAFLIVSVLELILILVSGLSYLDMQIKLNASIVSVSIVLVLFVYLFYLFKLNSDILMALVFTSVFIAAIISLWNAKAKSIRYYLGIILLGIGGGGLITYRFFYLSWISIVLGAMTSFLLIYVSFLLEAEDEVPIK